MKKTIATLAFIGILAVNNAFAGILLSDFAQTEPEPTQCTQQTEDTSWGIMLSDLIEIVTGEDKSENSQVNCGILLSD
jgi:hypothetical protein